MRRILRGIVGTLLASSVLGLTRPAVAQTPTIPESRPSPSLDPKDEDLRLPTIVPAKPANTRPMPSGAKAGETNTTKPPTPVMKWGQGTISWESPDDEPSATMPAAKGKNGQPAPKSPPQRSPSTRDSELRLPTILPAKPPKTSGTEAVKPPAPVMKWGQPAMSWESTVKKKPTTTPAAKGDASKDTVAKPAKKSKPDSFASEPHSSELSPALTVPATPKRWQRPVTSEESEPQVKPSAKPAKPKATMQLPSAKPAKPKAAEQLPSAKPAKPSATTQLPVARPATPSSAANSGRVTTLATPPSAPPNRPARPSAAPLDRPMHWPPAYDVRPPETKAGRPGVIVFEEESEPPQPAGRSAVLPELKQQVMSVCGRQARDVSVETQRDGSVLVKVKVASASIGDKLTHKILTIPQMASPKVRLTMDITP